MDSDYTKSIGADYYRSTSSNGGGLGSNYLVVDVDFIAFSEGKQDRGKVNSILEKYSNTIKEAELSWEGTILKERAKVEESKKNKDVIKPKIDSLVTEYINLIEELDNDKLSVEFDDDYISLQHPWGWEKYPYSQESIDNLQKKIDRTKEYISDRDTYMPQFKEYQESVPLEGYKFTYTPYRCIMIKPDGKEERFDYDSYDFPEFLDALNDEYNKLEKEKKERAERYIELQRKVQKEKAEKEAYEEGYPSNLSFHHRIGGVSGQETAYVITPEGISRPFDYFNWDNPNHRYHSTEDQADGLRSWYQILPGELVITFGKMGRGIEPEFNIEWAPTEITKEQIEYTKEITEHLRELYPDMEEAGHKIGWEEAIYAAIPSKLNPPTQESMDIQDNINDLAR